jgi:DNA-binding MarR family transcriptional regulator
VDWICRLKQALRRSGISFWHVKNRQHEKLPKGFKEGLTRHILAYTTTGEWEIDMAAQKKNRTEDVISRECLVVRLRMLNRVVTNIYDDALRPLGVKASQLNILVVTAKLGLARPAEVCQRLQLDTSTLSRNVERMRARDWLEVVDDDDGRAQPFRLTAKGRRLLERAMPAWKEAQAKVKKLIGADAVDSIDAAVRRIRAEQSNT